MACPIVAVNVWYHVGSKNEVPGRTGFAHLFEHLMFEGSQHYDRGYFHPLQEAGAALNGSTNADRTNYWEVVPTNALDLALWMESDRMGYLLPALTDAKFENQRDVVLNERRQNYENRPYGLAGMAIVAALYPPDHPYHWLTIGDADDLRAAQLDDVRAFFQRYYHPRNASLALAGDIDTATRRLRWRSGTSPRFPAAPRRRASTPAPPRRLPTRSRLVLEDRVELPRLYIAWHSPALFADGDAELDLVAEVLAERQDVAPVSRARLRTADRHRGRGVAELARSSAASSRSSRPPRRGGRSPRSSARSAKELGGARSSAGPTAGEMERCLAQAESHFIFRLQTVGGFGGKSDQLNAYNIFLGDPGYFERDLERYRAATRRRRCSSAAARGSLPRQRVVLSVVPRGRLGLALDGSQPVAVS